MIIFDALEMQLQSTNLRDVAVCLVSGKCMTLIWTYQEIYLARRALIIKGRGFVDCLDMSRQLRALSGLNGHLPGAEGIRDAVFQGMNLVFVGWLLQ